jgi:phosphoribosyl 1,2-cyclic phosphate phosphodiesterase
VEGESNVLIDCSTDFRQQALTHQIDRLNAVLFTHNHADHISGIDDLRIYNLLHHRAIDVYGNEEVINDIRRRYAYCFNPVQIGGGVPQFELHQADAPFHIGPIAVTPIPVWHGNLQILAYRLNDFCYVTDANKIPESSLAHMQELKILVINALREKPFATHFSLGEALEIAQTLHPRQVYFTHISHRLDHEETNRSLPPGYQLAYDGLTLDVD